MKSSTSIIQHFAPTLAIALDGPFADVATKLITDKLVSQDTSDGDDELTEYDMSELLKNPKNLQKIKNIEEEFKREMDSLGVDVTSLDNNPQKNETRLLKTGGKPQMVISVLFLAAYFGMLAAILIIETSDTLNMMQGENSLIGELQILFGVLTAGVGQILSYWFGGALKKGEVAT